MAPEHRPVAPGLVSNITAAMEASGHSVKSLAETAGIARSTLQLRLAHPAGFKVGELERVAAALNLDLTIETTIDGAA